MLEPSEVHVAFDGRRVADAVHRSAQRRDFVREVLDGDRVRLHHIAGRIPDRLVGVDQLVDARFGSDQDGERVANGDEDFHGQPPRRVFCCVVAGAVRPCGPVTIVPP
jgi:hypothetical protein